MPLSIPLLQQSFTGWGSSTSFPSPPSTALGVDDLLDHVTKDFPVAEDSGPGSDSAPVGAA